MNFLRKVFLFAAVIVLAYLLSYQFGKLYSFIFNDSGTWVDLTGVVGIPLSYTFFLPFLFTAFGGSKKYWWIGVLLIPALVFEVYFDLSHIHVPVALGIVGWLIGLGVSKVLSRRKATT